jgi:hypothetical protein
VSDIESRLDRAGRQWQQAQPAPPDVDLGRLGRTRERRWIPLAVATAVVAVVAVAVVLPLGRAAKHPLLSPSSPAPPPSPSASVHREDLDGDGRIDTTTLRWVRHSRTAPFRGVVRVSIDFGGGGRTSYDVRISRWIDPADQERLTVPSFGTSQVNAVDGLEIVVTSDDGAASYRTYRVLTLSGKRQLQPVPPPGRRGWVTGASVGTGALGYQCNEASILRVSSVPVRHGYAVHTVTYHWDGSQWARWSSERRVQRRSGIGAWSCYGLENL